MRSPTRELRSWRAGRDFVEKIPKSMIPTVCPLERAPAMVENMASTAVWAPALNMDARVATRAESSALVTRIPLGTRFL